MGDLNDSAKTEAVVLDLGQKLVLACKILEKRGIFDYAGHLSVRIPGQGAFLINPSMGPGAARLEDLLTVDLDGRVVSGTTKPNLEWPLHACTYLARPDVAAVVHTHAFMSRVFSVSPVKLVPVVGRSIEAFGLEGVPIYDGPGLITKVEQGRAVAAALGNNAAVLLRGHGDVVVGRSVEEMVYNAIQLDHMARVLQSVLAHGEPKYFTPDEADGWASVPTSVSYERAWKYWTTSL